MTAKRTHGPCTCGAGAMLTAHAEGRIALAEPSNVHHDADCPSLYPAQQEQDALTRLCILVRQRWTTDADDRPITDVLDLISEAREEQRKAKARARDAAADAAYAAVLLVYGDAVRAKQIADAVMSGSEP